MEDHPRVGGEKPARRRAFKRPTGSPPRGRGKVLAALMPENRLGITPAWAGKRYTSTVSMVACWDHPRVGGEKPRKPTMSRKRHRITPAWAGKRCRYGVCAHRGRDHPRVGGEKRWCTECSLAAKGSPPRGRGKVYSVYREVCYGGITPAWAGKRRSLYRNAGSSRDHPRMGGEKLSVLSGYKIA